MQNRTELVGVPLGERLGQMAKNNRGLLEGAGTVVLAFVMAGSYLFGDISPFGVAFVAAVKPKRSAPAALGAVLGYLLSPVVATNMKYIGAVILVGVLQWAFASSSLLRRQIVAAPVVAGGALGVTSFAVTFATGIYLPAIALSASETMLAAGSAYFFARSLQTVELGLEKADKNDSICLLVSLGIAVTTLGRVEAGGISLGRLLAVLAVLICAGSGEGPGAIAGIGAGTTASLMGSSYSFLMGAYALGGLVGGMFSPRGRMGTAVAFVLGATAVSILAPTQGLMMSTIYEALIGAGVYLLLPGNLLARLRFSQLRTGAQSEGLLRELLFGRLRQMAEGLVEISDTTRQVSQKLDSMAAADVGSVYGRLADGVCRRCGYRDRCWQLQYSQTMNALSDAMLILKKEKQVEKGQLPPYFAKSCCKLDAFTTALNQEYGEYLRSVSTRRKVSQVRSVVTDQFEGVAMMLRELSGELGHIASQDYRCSGKLLEHFAQLGMDPTEARCYLDDEGRMTVEVAIAPHKLPRLEVATAALDVGDLCDRPMDLPSVAKVGNETVITFLERSVYTVEYGAFQIVEEGSRITGDAYQHFNDRRGNSIAILSDGMGSGGSAAVDSAMTAGLLTRLLQSGVGFDAALKMVNSALLVKSGEESLATVDIGAVNLYTGRVSFYKAGAAPSFVVRGGRVGYVESTSLPAGILRGVAFEKSSMTLREGDLFLLCSDGVTATGVEWIPSQIESCKGESPQAIAEQLARTAKDRALPGRDDDITVVAARIEKG